MKKALLRLYIRLPMKSRSEVVRVCKGQNNPHNYQGSQILESPGFVHGKVSMEYIP